MLAETRAGRVSALSLAALIAVAVSACNAERDPDVNDDGVVNILDVSLVSSCLGQDSTVNAQCTAADIDRSGLVDPGDLDRVVARFGEDGFPIADRTPPVVTLTAPENLSFDSDPSILVEGFVDDPDASVHVNGVAVALSGGTPSRFSLELTLHEGENLISASASDAAGNTGGASVSVVLDTAPPRLTIDAPTAGSVTTQPSVFVSGMINDIVVGTVNEGQAQVSVNGVGAAVSNRSYVAQVALVPGANAIDVVGSDRAGNTATATSSVVFEPAMDTAEIHGVGGDGQIGAIGELLPEALMVELLDPVGAPAAGAMVVFRVMEGDGLLDDGALAARAVVVVSDAAGRAQASWTLGTRAGAGNQRVRATATGFAGSAEFVASALSGTPTGIVAESGALQAGVVGSLLPRPFQALVVDVGGNRLPGIPVEFEVVSGGGSLDGAPAQTLPTNADGIASAVLTLGPAEGDSNQVVSANIVGSANAPIRFAASARVPGDAAETQVSGVVLDDTDTAVPGATVHITGTALFAQTDEQGLFALLPAPVGAVHLEVDGTTTTRPGDWPRLAFELVTVAGRDNTLGMPIFLPQLDLTRSVCVDETSGGALTLDEVPGFRLEVAPGSVTFAGDTRSGCVSVTTVHPDRVPMPPNLGGQPRLVVTIQPAGAVFEPPAPLTLPNADGLAPGVVTDLFSFDHDLGQFVSIGTGTVSEDGARIQSDPGVGILKAGWHGNWVTRIGARAAGCPEIDSCRDAFFSFDQETFGCQIGGNAENGKACTPEPKGAKIEVKVGAGVVTPLPDGEAFDPDEPGELFVVGEDEDVDEGVSPEEYCDGGSALPTNVVVGDSCLGMCRSGSCEPGLFGDSQVKQATCLMLDTFYECMPPGALTDRLTEQLQRNGLRVSCRANEGYCSGFNGYSFAPNAVTLCENGRTTPVPILFHELIHNTSGKGHNLVCKACLQTPFDGCCVGDLAYGCTRRCFPSGTTADVVGDVDACQ